MPELPEVETVVLQLKNKVVGKKIKKFFLDYYSSRNFKRIGKSTLSDLEGKKIDKVKRGGKNILIYIGEYILLIHQKMSGPLVYDNFGLKKKVYLGDELQKHIHFCIFFEKYALGLYDTRVFAKVVVGKQEEVENSLKIGIDAMSDKLDGKLFHSLLLKRKMRIKPFLLDQTNIAGVGNIYADESLFCAGIHPETVACKLSYLQGVKLLGCIKKILQQAIKLKGSSISDYVDIEGSSGQFSLMHKVYQREGEKCVKCGSIIKKIQISGRYARFCPKCQKWLK